MNFGIETHLKSRRAGPVAEVFDTWNKVSVASRIADEASSPTFAVQNFFHPRQLDVMLARGKFCYSGIHEGLPPDMQGGHTHHNQMYHKGEHVSDDDYSSSDDSHSERTARRREKRAARKEKRCERRADRQERRCERRADRREKRKERRDFINASESKWRLVITPTAAAIA